MIPTRPLLSIVTALAAFAIAFAIDRLELYIMCVMPCRFDVVIFELATVVNAAFEACIFDARTVTAFRFDVDVFEATIDVTRHDVASMLWVVTLNVSIFEAMTCST